VLVIEDQPRDREDLIHALTAAGYAVEAASTGAQAISLARTRRYDAVTLDLGLPDMSGLDVLKEIRVSGPNRDVPVVIVTVAPDGNTAAAFEVHDVLAKPLDGEILLASLRRAHVVPGPSGSVLIVDDDAGSLRLMAATLAQLGYESRTASSGDAALGAARESPPRAVVLDLIMPGMDGFRFLEAFRRVPGCRRTPVIVWTMKDLTAEELVRLRESVQGVVQKGRGGGAAVLEELTACLPRAKPS
jgi:CheY-like chemotaxis protein